MNRVCARARRLLTQGRAGEALEALQPALDDPRAATPECWMLAGHAWMALGQPANAADAFRAWLEREPRSLDARMRLAAALADDQRGREAETEIRTCIRAGASAPDATFILARALMAQGRYEEAEAGMRKVVRARPDHLTAQNNLSELVWMRTGDAGAASRELDAALRTRPDLSVPLRAAEARLWMAARQPGRALAVVDAGLARNADDPALLKAAAGIALEFDGARALEYAERALRAAPDDAEALTAFGNASLAVGRAAHALDAAERLCLRNPADGEALAMRADALRMGGDARYRELLDYTHFVRAEFLDVPAGWPDLDAYLGDLVRELEAAHTRRAHPVSNSLRGGSQVQITPERFAGAAVRAFPAAIDGPIRRYMEALGHGNDAMRCRNHGGYQLAGMWSVRLRPNGFHVNHYHPAGWMSSSCYLRLPTAVAAHRGEGWLKFGEPAFPTTPALPPEYFLRPEPGLLALFPAYLWHGTVPFPGAAHESRLTIAFDVAPASA